MGWNGRVMPTRPPKHEPEKTTRMKSALSHSHALSFRRWLQSRPSLAAICCLASLFSARADNSYLVVDPRFGIATDRHVGENLFGSSGIINKRPIETVAELAPVWIGSGADGAGALRLTWKFQASGDPEEFIGAFFAMRRPALDTVRPDGTPGPPVDFPASVSVDLYRFEKTGTRTRSIDALRFTISENSGSVKCTVRAGLTDAFGKTSAARVLFDPATGSFQDFRIRLAEFRGIDLSHVVQVGLVIEERHIVDGVVNPQAGSFDICSIEFFDADGPDSSATAVAALPDREFVNTLARHEFETLWRLADPKTGFSWDRTLFPDLLHSGATGSPILTATPSFPCTTKATHFPTTGGMSGIASPGVPGCCSTATNCSRSCICRPRPCRTRNSFETPTNPRQLRHFRSALAVCCSEAICTRAGWWTCA